MWRLFPLPGREADVRDPGPGSGSRQTTMVAEAGAWRRRRLILSVSFYWILFSCRPVLGLEEISGKCGLTIDLVTARNTHSAILRMPLPQSMSRYQDPTHPVNCDIIITFTSGTSLLIELYFLDIMPRSNDMKKCTTGLEVFDQTGRKYYGSRICMEGWQWEERHREKKYEKHLVENSPLTFRLVSEGPYRGEGFSIHFNQLRPTYPCYIQEFKCQQIQRCVHDDLTCDGWDDCGDYSDERMEAGCDMLTASEICSIIMGVVLLLGVTAQIVIFCLTYRRLALQYGRTSDARYGSKYNMEPNFGLGQRYSSEDSLPSRNSRSSVPSRKRQEFKSDTVGRLEQEKESRRSQPSLDDQAEDIRWSSGGRSRAQSEGAVSHEPVTKTGHQRHTLSQSSLNRDRREPIRGIDNPALDDNDSLRKGTPGSRVGLSDRDRDRERTSTSDSDSDDYDGSRRRRRRSSHERSRERDCKKSQYDDEEDEHSNNKYRRGSYDSSDDKYRPARGSRQTSQERYGRGKFDDSSDSDKERYRQVDNSRHRRDGHDRGDEDNDRPIQQNARGDSRRQSSQAGRDNFSSPSRGNQQSRNHDDLESLEAYRDSPTMFLPPPYSEDDTGSLDEYSYKWPPLPEKLRDQQTTHSPVSNKNNFTYSQDMKLPAQEIYRRSSGDRRERYSQNRWTTKQGSQNSLPLGHNDATFKSVPVEYKEESV